VIRDQALELQLETAAVAVADIERTRQHQWREIDSFLDVMPLNVEDRGGISQPVVDGPLGADLIVVGRVRCELAQCRRRHVAAAQLARRQRVHPAAAKALRPSGIDQVGLVDLIGGVHFPERLSPFIAQRLIGGEARTVE
jgi:hypothetical protein